jgi:ArsR family transcriptional regulator, arsenate/arsenite/antimonite-responsive transcriptional repressor
MVFDRLEHIGIYRYMQEAVAFAKALADSTRLRVITALRQRELCVCELCDALEATQSTLSTHLTLLREAGITCTRKQGKWIYYRLSNKAAPLIETFLRHFGDATRDKRMHRDSDRLRQRLKLRENGCCSVGFTRGRVQKPRKRPVNGCC